MAAGVVDVLELVDVYEQDGQGGVLAVEPSQRQGQPVDQQDPVGQAGQGVVEGPVMHLGRGRHPRRHVVAGDHHAPHGGVVEVLAQPVSADQDFGMGVIRH